MSLWHTGLAAGTVLCGCHINVVALEYIVLDPVGKRFGATITFLQFLFISVWTSLYNFEGYRKPRSLVGFGIRPKARSLKLVHLLLMAAVFWLVSTITNVTFRYNISIPLHTVFRSSSLIVSILLGRFAFGHTYTSRQVLSAVAVTLGVSILTLQSKKSTKTDGRGDNDESSEYGSFVIGVTLLAVTVCLSAALGLLQDYIYSAARRERVVQKSSGIVLPPERPFWREAVFYSHAFTLPLFLVWYSGELVEFVSVFPAHLTPYLIVNIASQCVCILGVYSLTSLTSSFTMTLTITLRKFASLVFSIVYFGHWKTFSFWHYFAVGLTMVGVILYVAVPSKKEGSVPATPVAAVPVTPVAAGWKPLSPRRSSRSPRSKKLQ